MKEKTDYCYLLSVADVLIEINFDKPLEMSEAFQPFTAQAGKADISIKFKVTEHIAVKEELPLFFQTVDKLGVGCYTQHHFSFKTSFLFIFFEINKNLTVFQPRFSKIFASFFRFMHAKVSPAFISIRAFPTYCVYRNPCCSFAVPNILSMVSFLN